MKDRPRGKGLWALTDRDLAAGRWVSTTSLGCPCGLEIDPDEPHVPDVKIGDTHRSRPRSRSVGVHDFS